MQAVFEIQEMSQDWKPPFKKNRSTRTVTVAEGDSFEPLRQGDHLFTLKGIHGSRVLLAYNRLYTLKGYEHPTERQIWLEMNEGKAFSSLWDENGITKTIYLRDLHALGGNESAESAPSSSEVQ
jgi:tricorn protease-like protein